MSNELRQFLNTEALLHVSAIDHSHLQGVSIGYFKKYSLLLYSLSIVNVQYEITAPQAGRSGFNCRLAQWDISLA